MTQTPVAGLDAASIRVHRKGSGPPLVLLHCLGVDHGLWDIAAAGLEDNLTLLSYDFPGHGETRVPDRGYSIEDLSRQLAAVLAREGVAHAHVAGISLGKFGYLGAGAGACASAHQAAARTRTHTAAQILTNTFIRGLLVIFPRE